MWCGAQLIPSAQLTAIDIHVDYIALLVSLVNNFALKPNIYVVITRSVTVSVEINCYYLLMQIQSLYITYRKLFQENMYVMLMCQISVSWHSLIV